MEELISKIVELMKIKSISGNQLEIARVFDWIKTNYDKAGIYVSEWSFNNDFPVMLLANCEGYDFDVVAIGHIDVVPAKDELFIPKISGNRLYGRGSFDMKSSVIVCLENLLYTIGKNIRYGVLITSDEETTSSGMKAMQKADIINADVVFDTDSGGNIVNLVDKYKHPVSVEIFAKGKSSHSSRPWDGVNAVNGIINTIKALEKYFPQYEEGKQRPKSTWVDTMVVTAFNSPATYNVVPAEASAWLNFRLTEKTSLAKLRQILDEACNRCGSKYKVLLSSSGVYMNVKAPAIKKYIQIAESIIGEKVQIVHSDGATDSRMFADKSTIIMHSISGANAHGDHEYAEIDSIFMLEKIQKAFIDSLI